MKSFFFRIGEILSGILILLLLVIFIHISLQECIRVYNNNNSNDIVEDQVIDEDFEHIPDSSTFLITVLILFLKIMTKMYLNLPTDASILRFNLLLADSFPLPTLLIYLTNFYWKNPYLRKYVWKKIFNSSAVEPQNIPAIEIELQSISAQH